MSLLYVSVVRKFQSLMGCLRKVNCLYICMCVCVAFCIYMYICRSLIIVPAINLVMGFYVWLLNMAAAAAFSLKLLLDIS